MLSFLTSKKWSLRRLALLPLLIVSGCGGGADSKSKSQPLADSGPTAHAQALPPGWVGRAPTYEVINGISVPPAPAPSTNDATAAGVDLNKNGVRDDVERAVAAKVLSKADFDLAMKEAALLQRTVLPVADRAAALQLTKDIMCASYATPSEVGDRTLQDLTITTDQRRLANKEFARLAGPIGGGAPSACPN